MKPDVSQVKIEVLSMKDASRYIASTPLGDDGKFDEFKIFNPNSITSRVIKKNTNYNNLTLDSPYEEQTQFNKFDSEYDIGIFAIHKNAFIGANIFRWEYTNFWAYNHRILDVHKDWRGVGIAPKMMMAARDAPELENKILRFGRFENEGAQKIIHNIFKNTTKHAVIPLTIYQNIPTELKFHDIG